MQNESPKLDLSALKTSSRSEPDGEELVDTFDELANQNNRLNGQSSFGKSEESEREEEPDVPEEPEESTVTEIQNELPKESFNEITENHFKNVLLSSDTKFHHFL